MKLRVWNKYTLFDNNRVMWCFNSSSQPWSTDHMVAYPSELEMTLIILRKLIFSQQLCTSNVKSPLENSKAKLKFINFTYQ